VILDNAGLSRLILAYIWREDLRNVRSYNSLGYTQNGTDRRQVFGRLVEEALLDSRSTMQRQLMI